jgi:rhamnosyl/mannosyltransferase
MFPSVLAQSEGDILHLHEPFPLADIAILTRPAILQRFKRLVITWHGDIARQAWAMPLYHHLVNHVLSKASRIMASSPQLVANSAVLHPFRDRCTVLPLGLDLSWVASMADHSSRVNEIRRTYGTPLVLSVGRLVYYKGLRYLVDAMRGIPGAHAVIIGSGPLEEALREQIRAAGLDQRVHVLPHQSEEELHAFYKACDVFVLPSIARSEAYGLVQVEAMACGKPVISTEINTGTTFVNQDGLTGLTVPPSDAGSLASALGRLLGDDGLRTTLGENARMRALNEFTVDRMIARTLEVYRSVLAGEIIPAQRRSRR